MKRKGKWLILENDEQAIVNINKICAIRDDGGGETRIRTNNTSEYFVVKGTPEEVLKIIRRKDR